MHAQVNQERGRVPKHACSFFPSQSSKCFHLQNMAPTPLNPWSLGQTPTKGPHSWRIVVCLS